MKRTAARETYALNKIKKLEDNVTEYCCNENQLKIKVLENLLIEKDKEIRQLKSSNEYLQDLINEKVRTQQEIQLFDEDKNTYKSELKQCVYELLQYQVSAAKVSAVIASVLKLAHLMPDRMPCRTSVLEMSIQQLYLAQIYLVEVFAKDTNTVLITDETSRFGSKYMGYEAADSDGNLWVLGLREIETKSADHTLKVFKEILKDLDENSKLNSNQISSNIICHIVATLSDRAATEVKFNSLLSDNRRKIHIF